MACCGSSPGWLMIAVLPGPLDSLRLTPNSGPFANADVRRAVSMALDRPALVQGPYQDVGKPAVSPIIQAMPLTNGTGQYYSYNVSAPRRCWQRRRTRRASHSR
jgi:ABC-type transport system substrate-binding protein